MKKNHVDLFDKIVKQLKMDVFEKVPNSVCLKCPNSDKVVAECCRKASPALYSIEFAYVNDFIAKNWDKEKRKRLIYSAFEAFLSDKTEKVCLLLNQEDNTCTVYPYRWLNCRTYGMVSNFDWIQRAKNWIKEQLSEKITKKEDKIIKYKSKINGVDGKTFYKNETVNMEVPDNDKIDKYIETLFENGFNADSINNKLEVDYKIKNIVYEQCKNLKIDLPFFDLDEIYKNLYKLESLGVGYDISEDPEDRTYMQFHVYLLCSILGKQKMETIYQMKLIWNEEKKDHFLAEIKRNIELNSCINFIF